MNPTACSCRPVSLGWRHAIAFNSVKADVDQFGDAAITDARSRPRCGSRTVQLPAKLGPNGPASGSAGSQKVLGMQSRIDAAVVGAGIAGLAAAHRLHSLG